MDMKITAIDDKMICLNLNPKHEINESRQNIKVKVKNIKCARPKYKHIFITIKIKM
jgi:hypothetical protein